MGEIYTVIWTFYSLGNTWYNQFVQHQRNWLDWVIKINTRNRSTWSWDPALSCPKRPQIRSRQDQIFSSNHRSSFQKRPRFSFVIINSTDFFNLYTITQLGSSFKIRTRRCKMKFSKFLLISRRRGPTMMLIRRREFLKWMDANCQVFQHSTYYDTMLFKQRFTKEWYLCM